MVRAATGPPFDGTQGAGRHLGRLRYRKPLPAARPKNRSARRRSAAGHSDHRPWGRTMYSKILVPIDGSPTAERGLREALALAAPLGAKLVLLNVVDDYPILLDMGSALAFEETRRALLKLGEEVLDRARRQAAEADVPCECVLREVTSLRASDAIVDEAAARKCDLIVMGTHGRRGFNRLAMGSDAEIVVRESPVPVLLVRFQPTKAKE
jgi:nucleotide-binding universal stress UspA family protein